MNSLSAGVLLTLSLVLFCGPQGSDAQTEEPPKQKTSTRLHEDAKAKLRKNCLDEQGQNTCRGQKEEHKNRRDVAKKHLLRQVTFQHGINESEAEERVERRLAKIHEVKKTWHRLNGIEDIEPADDGVWAGDTILTEEQAHELIRNLEAESGSSAVTSTQSDSELPKRSASIFFEAKPHEKWSMPIHYWISPPDFSEYEKSLIRLGIAAITNAATCITFVEDHFPMRMGSQLQYRAYRPTDSPDKNQRFCGGLATAGHQGVQDVILDFCPGVNLAFIEGTGLATHETIHALGGHHEHQRTDRDLYIEVLYDNIQPQWAYAYAVMPCTTSYGVKYDYFSIMHYWSGGMAIDPSRPTMRSRVDTGGFAIGSRSVLTAYDKLQLNRMYCRPPTCLDRSDNCGHFWDLGYCDWSNVHGSWMWINCPKSCGFC